jgi:serine/threonine-protein kinase ULK4
MKQVLVAALGEFLFYVASEEEREGKVLPKWKVPSSAYSVVARSLREGEAAATQLYALKTIMNIASTGSRQCEPFSSCEIILSLWTIYRNCKQDAVKALSLSAICRLIRFDPILGQHLVDRVGLQQIICLLVSPHSKFQQPVINLFNVLLANNIVVRKLLVDKDFLSHTIQLLEHPLCLLRAKGYLTVALSAEHSSETLLSCCQIRLVSCIDRDVRRQTSQSKSLDDSALYLMHCLDYLIATILKLIPEMTGGILESLTAVSGRKHPSAAQSKVLRANLPLLPVLGYFASSSVFATEMLTKSFLTSVATLLTHAVCINCGEAGLGSNAGLSNANFCDSVFDVLEACLTSSHTIVQHADIVVQELLPSVAMFLQSGHLDAYQSMAAGIIRDTLNRVIVEGDKAIYCDGLQVLVREYLSPSLPPLLGHSGPSRLGALQLVATLVEADCDCLALVAQDTAVIHALMDILQECSGNVQLPSFLLVMTIIRHVSTSSHLDRSILHTAGLCSHMVSSLDQLTVAISDQSQRLPQQQHQLLSLVSSTLECLSTQLEYLLVLQQHAQRVGENRPVDKQMEAHSELLICIPSLFELICLEDVGELVGQCLLLLLQLYSHQFKQQFGIKEMKFLLSALESASSAEQEVVILSVTKGLVNSKIAQDASHIQEDNIKQIKQNVLRMQKRTSEKHIKKLTGDVLQLLRDVH